MRAAFYNRYGTSEVLEIGELPEPGPSAGEVLIRVAAISLNPRDTGIRNGELKWLTGKSFPKLTGADFSGSVVAIGTAVKYFAIGDQVFGYIQSVKGGCSAESIAVPQNWIAKKNGSIPHVHAAALPCTYLTALQGLQNKAKIKRGDRVLVYGASGGVGTATIQLAKYFGAHVTAVCSTKNIAYCKAQGADDVWDYNVTDVFSQESRFDIFFQAFSRGGLLYKKGKKLLTEKGIYLTLIPSPRAVLLSVVTSIRGGKNLKPILVRSNRDDLEFIDLLVKQGKLTPHISATYNLENIQRAHQLVESNHAVGKIIVTLNEQVRQERD